MKWSNARTWPPYTPPLPIPAQTPTSWQHPRARDAPAMATGHCESRSSQTRVHREELSVRPLQPAARPVERMASGPAWSNRLQRPPSSSTSAPTPPQVSLDEKIPPGAGCTKPACLPPRPRPPLSHPGLCSRSYENGTRARPCISPVRSGRGGSQSPVDKIAPPGRSEGWATFLPRDLDS